MRYKSTGFGSLVLALMLTACSRLVPNASIQPKTPCLLYEAKGPVQLEFEGLKHLLNDFELSHYSYDALVVQTKGGNPLKYWRVKLMDQSMEVCRGDERQVPQYIRHSGYHNIIQLFDRIEEGYYSGIMLKGVSSSELGSESILIKKNGKTTFSYSFDDDCMDNLSSKDKAKIVKARELVSYIEKLD